MKDFRIFEDYESRFSTKLPDYSKGTPIFQGFLFADNNNEQFENLYVTHIGQKAKEAEIVNNSPPPSNKGRKVNDVELIPSIVITLTSKDRMVEDAKFRTEDAMKKTRIGYIITLSVKAKDAIKV